MSELAKPVLAGEGGSDYERYLRTDELLRAAEDGRTSGSTATSCSSRSVHQTSEIWLKLAWNEIEEAARLVARRRPRGGDPAAAPRERLLQARHVGARHARAHVAVGVHRGAQGARSRQRLRLARVQGDPPRRRSRSARRSTRRTSAPG